MPTLFQLGSDSWRGEGGEKVALKKYKGKEIKNKQAASL